MKTFKYRIFETPKEDEFVLAGISKEGDQQIIAIANESRCKKILKDIENGVRDAIGCRLVLEKEIEIREALDVN